MLTRLCIFAALITLCPVGSEAAPPPAYVVVINDGNISPPGMNYVDAAHPWSHMATANAHLPGIHLKHPFGLWQFDPADPKSSSMVFDQASRMRAYAAANPDDKDAQARADFGDFAKAWSNRPAKQFLSIYVGGLWSIPILPGDTPQKLANRAYDELAPIRAACPDLIVFDNDYARNEVDTPAKKLINGPQGAKVRLHRMLRKDGIEVGIEPGGAFAIERDHDHWNVFSDLIAGKVVEAEGWDKYQGGKFRDPHKAPRCFYEIAGRGLTLDQKREEFKKSVARGEIPLVFIGDVNKGLLEGVE